MTLRITFLVKEDCFKIKITNLLGSSKILKLLLEYLTKLSVKKEIDKISTNLVNEYINGIIEGLFFKNLIDINLDRESTSRQHKFNP